MIQIKKRTFCHLLSSFTMLFAGIFSSEAWGTESSLDGVVPLIQTMDIAPVNPDTYGIQVEGNSIPLDIWKGLTHGQVRALLEKLSAHQPHPVLKRLQKQLMLSGTYAPEKNAEDQGSILAIRVKHLEAMNDIGSAYLLAKQYPEVLESSDWLWLQFLNALTFDSDREAFKIASGALEKYPDDLKWSKAIIGLQLLKEEHEAALLGLSLLEEKKTQELNSFLAFARQKAEKKAVSPDFYPKDFLEWKLSTHNNLLKEEREEFLGFFIKSTGFQKLPPQQKLLMGEKAYLKGLWTKEQLLGLYQEHAPVVPKKSLAEGSMNDDLIALSDVPFDFEQNDPLVRAKFYSLIAAEDRIDQKAKILYQALQHMHLHNHSFLNPIFIDFLKTLPIQVPFKSYAKYFAQALLEEGEETLAVRWLALVSIDDKVDLAPWIILGVNDISLSAKQKLFSTWYASLDPSKQNALMLGVFEALVPSVTENRGVLLPLSSVDMGGIEMGLFLPLHFALASQKGVAFVYALLLGQEVFRSLNPSPCLPLLIEALKSLGYQREARTLALDFIKQK